MAPKSRRDCLICLGKEGDGELRRVQVWEDPLWRVTTSLESEVSGFSYLEPKRHIPHLTDLDGTEARTLGAVLGRTARALKRATGAHLVYVYVFGGGIPHLHLHLAPHREGDALNEQIIRGEAVVETLPSGATRVVSKDHSLLQAGELRAVADRIRVHLSRGRRARPSRGGP
jgi:diadenosine tetraphosphate (Ap4A) HIT family hydrolase